MNIAQKKGENAPKEGEEAAKNGKGGATAADGEEHKAQSGNNPTGGSPRDGTAGEDYHKLYLEAKKTSEELLTKLKYMQADYENFRKRMAKERIETIALANGALISDILPALGELEAALLSMKEGSERRGIEMTYKKLLSALKESGLFEIPSSNGEAFNPDLHEATDKDPTTDPKLDGKISRVIRKGYMLNGSVLNFANVAVFALQK